MTRVLAYLTLALFPLLGQAQNDEKLVKQTINNLFNGMRQSDGQLVRAAFSDAAILQTIARDKSGALMVRTEQVDSFAAFIAKPHDLVYDERIRFASILIDGNLASVWTPYQFYVGEKFSHCGVNSFQLIKSAEGWKIQYLIDTRRRENCN